MAQVRRSVPAGPGKSHHQGWDEAIDAALAAASELGRQGTFDVDVQLWATITVTNPGHIQAYGATLTDHPGGGG
jgi:hypothetical protein